MLAADTKTGRDLGDPVYFTSNSFRLRNADHQRLKEVADSTRAAGGKILLISGFADPYGDSEYNLYLSKKRCQAVQRQLLRLGVDPDHLKIDERGAVDSAKDMPSWKKRRVEFSFLEATASL
jgi:outer membrane protein OmpA-like peptidoglycan-associated protein